MGETSPLGLFDGFGVELEYMIVDRESLAVRPIADRLLSDAAGAPVSDYVNGPVTWSNEIVNHVIELKTTGPAPSLANLHAAFHADVREINERLATHGAMLLPTAAHPFMDPLRETRLWPHEFKEIYELYDRIFDCRGHGWSNLQSMHLNLPFRDDEEFGRLHAAIRLVLPLIPALAASSPLLDGSVTGLADSRLEAYRHNQDRIPSLGGKVIPERAFTRAEYDRLIYAQIRTDLAPFDRNGVLETHFANSRGAIARFDRGAIEIRLVDVQECPRADLAVAALIVEVVRALANERWATYPHQRAWSEDDLATILLRAIRTGDATPIGDRSFLRLFGLDAESATAGAVWRALFEDLQERFDAETAAALDALLRRGTLSAWITRRLDPKGGIASVLDTYRELAVCLAENTIASA